MENVACDTAVFRRSLPLESLSTAASFPQKQSLLIPVDFVSMREHLDTGLAARLSWEAPYPAV